MINPAAAATATDQRPIWLDGIPAFEMKVHRSGDAFISPYILRDGVWEPCETLALAKMLSADTDFIDIGANIGWYTALASKVLEGRGTVHSFEPDPDNFSLLMKNISINKIDNARCYHAGVSDHSDGARLFLDRLNLGDHRLYDSNDDRPSVAVQTISIDAYDGIDEGRALIIKLDTQGSEVNILRGMKRLLDSHPKEIVLICEFWPFGLDRNSSSASELIDIVSAAGFEPLTIGESDLTKSSWSEFRERATGDCAPATQCHADFIAFRPESEMINLVRDMIRYP